MTGLLYIGPILEVKYPNRLTNIVLVPKNNHKFRMCLDYKDLNNAYPKDYFPLPNIDQMMMLHTSTSK